MVRSSAEFECECKVKTIFDYRVPHVGSPVFTDVTCHGCHAVWTMRFRKTTSGQVAFTFKLSIPSGKLGEYLEKKKLQEIQNAPQKKSPLIVVPGFRDLKLAT